MPMKVIRAVGRALAASGSSAAITGLVVDWLTNMLIVSAAIAVVKVSPLRVFAPRVSCHAYGYLNAARLDAPATI
jgi:hypothetical protein